MSYLLLVGFVVFMLVALYCDKLQEETRNARERGIFAILAGFCGGISFVSLMAFMVSTL